MRKATKSKIQLCLRHFRTIIGVIGILHGIPEILQGSKLVASNSIKALNMLDFMLMPISILGALIFALRSDNPLQNQVNNV